MTVKAGKGVEGVKDVRDLTREERQLVKLESEKVQLEINALKRDEDYIMHHPHRRGEFVLRGTITEGSVHGLMEKLDVWCPRHPGEPITVIINSQGGVVLDGYALYDYLEQVKKKGHHLKTLALGMAASMAGVLLQAGNQRVMGKRAWLLVHEVQGVVAGSFSQMDDDMKFNKKLQDQALDILSARSTISRRQIQNRWTRKDWWLSAADALKLGFIDAIEDDADLA